jgi:hypothetical protein
LSPSSPELLRSVQKQTIYIYIIYSWVNYNISLTWIVRPFGNDVPY